MACSGGEKQDKDNSGSSAALDFNWGMQQRIHPSSLRLLFVFLVIFDCMPFDYMISGAVSPKSYFLEGNAPN